MNRREFIKFMGAGIALCIAPTFNTFGIKECQRKLFFKREDTNTVIPVWQKRTYDPISQTNLKVEWSTDNGLTWNDIKLPIMIEI